jgi:hypothetical protein
MWFIVNGNSDNKRFCIRVLKVHDVALHDLEVGVWCAESA